MAIFGRPEFLPQQQRDSIYEPGRRSGSWIKLKCVNEQEFVVGGYTPPAGARKYFGALLVGYYDKERLLFAGKVGTGFDNKTLASLYKKLREERRDNCPFVDLPSKQGGEWVQGITPSEMRKRPFSCEGSSSSPCTPATTPSITFGT